MHMYKGIIDKMKHQCEEINIIEQEYEVVLPENRHSHAMKKSFVLLARKHITRFVLAKST